MAQNKVIRSMLNLPPRSHIGAEEFEMVGLLPVEKRVGQFKLGHVYNIFHSNAPVYMKNNVHISNSRTRKSVYNFNITRVGSFSKMITLEIVFIILVLSYGTIYLCLSALHKPEMGLK